METVINKICAHCKREIGDSEMAYIVGENLICPECDQKHAEATTQKPVGERLKDKKSPCVAEGGKKRDYPQGLVGLSKII